MIQKQKTITVFTPTFNRAYCLHRVYESLCKQTSDDFIWLIIDDGSYDNTKELVQSWIAEDMIEIQYHYKENGGMHTGHNAAYRIIITELNVCIDSDDYLPENAIEIIIKNWNKIENRQGIAGLIGLDADKEGFIIGTKIPEQLEKGSLYDLYNKHGVTGDKKLVLCTSIVKKYPAYPEYEGEKLVPLGLLYLSIGKDYDFVYSNEVFCIVEYQQDGSSGTILKQYKQSPRGFAYGRKMKIQQQKNFIARFKEYIHLVSSSLFAKDFTIAFKEVNPLMTLLALPFGAALHLYIVLKIK
jgi:glycosyltransferase involved in cell wall biosynthesis